MAILHCHRDAVDQVNLLLVSELPLLLTGMMSCLQAQPFVAHLYQASSLAAAFDIIKSEQIDVAAVELSLLKPSGLSAIRSLLRSAPALRLIVLSRREVEPFVTHCMEEGALGYLSLRSQPAELLAAIRAVIDHKKYLSGDAATAYALARLNQEEHLLSALSTREFQVFTRLAQGASVNEIAEALCLSPKTVHVYRRNIFDKLKVTKPFQLVLLALKYDVIGLDGMEG